jgi:hypothetical protein
MVRTTTEFYCDLCGEQRGCDEHFAVISGCLNISKSPLIVEITLHEHSKKINYDICQDCNNKILELLSGGFPKILKKVSKSNPCIKET